MNKLFSSLEAWFGWTTGFMLGFVTPIAPFIVAAVALTIADAVTGVIAAKKRGEKITSRGFYRTVQKIAVYMVSILACELVKVVFVPSIPITYGAAFAVAMVEIKSILENTRTVSGANIFQQIKGLIPGQSENKKGSEEE